MTMTLIPHRGHAPANTGYMSQQQWTEPDSLLAAEGKEPLARFQIFYLHLAFAPQEVRTRKNATFQILAHWS